ncbi:MAG: hypothetical protein ACNA8W_04810 [Bradymonadaceae bacterium]
MEDTPHRPQPKSLHRRLTVGVGLYHVVFHLIAVILTAALLAAPFLGFDTLRALWEAGETSGYGYLFGREVWIHLGVATCLWAALYLGWIALRQAFGTSKRAMITARGTVLTETLIVLPVALALIFGLAQLAVMNVAGMLTNLASVQAARTVWIWMPETRPLAGEDARRGVTRQDVAELARIQAAAAVTPAAPADLRLSPDVGSELFELMRGSFIASQLEWLPNDAGRTGIGEAHRLADARGETDGENLTFWRALDGSSFLTRTARKFTFAYLATEVEILERGEWVGARVTYKQLAAFPVTNYIFGTHDTVGERQGAYSSIVREFDLKMQLDPNAKYPRRSR